MPPGWAAFLKRSNKSQRLENWGARRAALRPYFFLSFILGSRRAAFRPHFFLPPKGWPFGDPGGDWTCSAEVNSACAKGDSAPLARAPWRAPSEMGPQERKKKNAARLGGIFETQQ